MSEHRPWSALTAPLLPVTMRGRPRQSWLDWKLASMMPMACQRCVNMGPAFHMETTLMACCCKVVAT